MKTVGIIAEYNPFHNGHLYHLEQAREMAGADYAVIVMSGDYTQRGTPAIFSKYMRARSALLSGADLVVELPLFGSSAPAADFADCGISLLTSMGIADCLSFGSECGSIDALRAQEEHFHAETEETSLFIKEGLKMGLTWPQAKTRALSLSSVFPDKAPAAPVSPNDILGVEYLRAIKKYHSSMEPYTLKRTDNGYHSLTLSGTFASASAIRRAITEQEQGFLEAALPGSFFTVLATERCPAVTFDDFSAILNEKLLTSTLEELESVSGMPADLAGKLFRERLSFHTAERLASVSKDRQYTYARVSRCLLNTVLGITKEDTEQFKAQNSAPWIRILGFRRDSAPLLTELKKRADIPIISKTADASAVLSKESLRLFEKHLRASELYRLVCELKTGQSTKNEYTRSIIIV